MSRAELRHIKNQEVLFDFKKPLQHVFFVLEGGFVLKYWDEVLANERTVNFFMDSFTPFMVDINSYFTGYTQASQLVAIKASKILAFKKEDIDFLSNQYDKFKHLVSSQIIEALIVEHNVRIQLITKTKQSFYAFLLTHHPQIIREVPSKYIAEFMGISPEWLSKIKKKASIRSPLLPVPMSKQYFLTSLHYPDDHRWAVDNMWTHAQPEELLPGIHRLMERMPSHPSFVHFEYWAGAARKRPDMAYSVEDDFFMSALAAWQNPTDDAHYTQVVTEEMRQLEPYSTGTQLADENLNHRTAKFMSLENLAKVDQIRKHWDPDGLFHEWHSRPISS